jgi:hypothetical protein
MIILLSTQRVVSFRLQCPNPISIYLGSHACYMPCPCLTTTAARKSQRFSSCNFRRADEQASGRGGHVPLMPREGVWFAQYNIAVARRLHDGPHHFNKVFLLRSIWLIKWLLAKLACPCWKSTGRNVGGTHTPHPTPAPALISAGY